MKDKIFKTACLAPFALYLYYTSFVRVDFEYVSFITTYEVYRFKTTNCPVLIHYSVRKLFTGLSKAAFAVCKQISNAVIRAKTIVAIRKGCAVTVIRYV